MSVGSNKTPPGASLAAPFGVKSQEGPAVQSPLGVLGSVGAPARLRMPRPILLACRALAETIRVPALPQQITDLSLSPWLSTALRPYMSAGTHVSRTVTGTNRHMSTTANLNKHVS